MVAVAAVVAVRVVTLIVVVVMLVVVVVVLEVVVVMLEVVVMVLEVVVMVLTDPELSQEPNLKPCGKRGGLPSDA